MGMGQMDYYPKFDYGTENPIFIPKKHTKQTPKQQKRQSKKRKNKK